MLRITEHIVETGTSIRLRLDGTIAEDSYPELAAFIARQRESSGTIVIIDMAGVEFINEEPARQLAQLRGERLRIINCSPFITTLLDTLGGRATGR